MVMATYKPSNSVPRIWYPGLDDKSTRAEIYEPIDIPMHAPLFFTYAPKGQTEAQFTNGSGAALHYGKEIFEEKSKYATIVTPYLNLMNKYANPYLLQRLRPKDAGPNASLCLALEVVETDRLRDFKRDEFGRYKEQGNGVFVEDAAEFQGIYAEWRIIPVKNGELGRQELRQGSALYHNDPTAISTIYPIMEFKAKWFGEQGNNIGVRLLAPVNGHKGASAKLHKENQAFIYGIQILKRKNNKVMVPTIQPTLFDRPTHFFSFKEDAYNPEAGDESMFFDETFMDQYENLDSGEPVHADIGEFHVYHQNIDTLLSKMMTAEKAAGGRSVGAVTDIEESKHLINFITGVDFENRPYTAVQIRGILEGSKVKMGEDSKIFLSGGSDGTMSNELYDELVREQFESFGDLETKFRDQGKYPFKQVYDCGFTPQTKHALLNVLIRRQDVNVTLSTVDIVTTNGRSAPDVAAESSIASSLVAQARMMVESEEFGTPAYRCTIIPSAYHLVNNPRYRKYVPMTHEIAAWRARFMSKPSGMIRDMGYDAPPYNHVTEGKNVTNLWANADVYQMNWANGLTYFAHKTDKIIFCPGVKTVYSNDTSTLTGDIIMQITCDINAYLYVVWASLSGNQKLSDEELISISNEMVINYTRSRYDNRVVVVPDTQLTRDDKTKGYSWTCPVKLYGRNMRTVMKAFIVNYRFGDLENG